MSKFILACLSGPTVDGREISKEQIMEMGEGYNFKLYPAQINYEHLRFFQLGKVLEAKNDYVETPTGKKLGLFIKPDFNSTGMDFIGNENNTLFFSAEINPEFPYKEKNGYYAQGFACTKIPAVLSLEQIKLSSQYNPSYVYSAGLEVEPMDLRQFFNKSNPSFFQGFIKNFKTRPKGDEMNEEQLKVFNQMVEKINTLEDQVKSLNDQFSSTNQQPEAPATPDPQDKWFSQVLSKLDSMQTVTETKIDQFGSRLEKLEEFAGTPQLPETEPVTTPISSNLEGW